MAKHEVIPAKHTLRVELSASRHGHKGCSKRRSLILKSLDNDNLLERLCRSIKALGHHRPWRQAPGKVLEGRRWNPSEHSFSKESSLSDGLLKEEGEAIYRRPIEPVINGSLIRTVGFNFHMHVKAQ